MQRIGRPHDSRFPYLPGIDALRALAVLAVFFYHAHVSWMPGGFLGVDLFFVISGYLITSLLLREFRRDGHLAPGRFWRSGRGRRSRRRATENRLAPASASTATRVVVRAHPKEMADGDPPSGHSAARRPEGDPRSAPTSDFSERPPRIVALGDSVTIGAEAGLAARLGPGFSMSAEVGRQANDFVSIVRRIKREGHHPEAMIIQMGNNGPLYGEDMGAIQKATSEVGELS